MSTFTQPRTYTVDQVCEILQVSRKGIYRMLDRGSLPKPGRVGRLLRWDAEAFDQWIAEGMPSVKRKVRA